MSQTDQKRTRSESCEDVLLLYTLETREKALNWVTEVGLAARPAIVPSAHGALDCGGWPFDGSYELLDLNRAKGCLPEDADLDFGVEVANPVFHLLRKESDGRFSVMLSSDYVKYAKKLPEPAAEATP